MPRKRSPWTCSTANESYPKRKTPPSIMGWQTFFTASQSPSPQHPRTSQSDHRVNVARNDRSHDQTRTQVDLHGERTVQRTGPSKDHTWPFDPQAYLVRRSPSRIAHAVHHRSSAEATNCGVQSKNAAPSARSSVTSGSTAKSAGRTRRWRKQAVPYTTAEMCHGEPSPPTCTQRVT